MPDEYKADWEFDWDNPFVMPQKRPPPKLCLGCRHPVSAYNPEVYCWSCQRRLEAGK